MDKKAALDAVKKAAEQTSGEMLHKDMIGRISRARLATLLAKNKEKLIRANDPQAKIVTDKLPTDTVKRFLAKKLDTHLGEASIDHVTPEVRRAAAQIHRMQQGSSTSTKDLSIGPGKKPYQTQVPDYGGSLKVHQRRPKGSKRTRVVHLALNPNMEQGTGAEASFSLMAADYRVNPKKVNKHLASMGAKEKWNPHAGIPASTLRHMDRHHVMDLPRLSSPQGALSKKGHRSIAAHEVLHVVDPAEQPGYGKRKRVSPPNTPAKFAMKHGRYPNTFDTLLPGSKYEREYMSGREERHAYSAIAGTYGVERLQSGGYSGSDVRDMLRRGRFETTPKKKDPVPVPTPADLKPKTRVGRVARRLRAGLTPGGYKAFAEKERERYRGARVAARIQNREYRDPYFRRDVESMIDNAASNYRDLSRRSRWGLESTKQERKAAQKFYKEVHKGIERRFGSNEKRLSQSAHGKTPLAVPRRKLPEEKEVQSVPSKFVRIRDPKRRPRSTDAALTEATKKQIRKRVSEVNIAPLDSAGDVGWGGPTGRTAHENL